MMRGNLVCSLHLIVLWTLCRGAGEESSITAQYGKDITLSCTFPSKPQIRLYRLSITWTKEGDQGQVVLVHRFCLNMNWLKGQEDAYRGRTQLYPDKFSQGNASLTLSDVRFQDEGSYICNVTCELGSWSKEISLLVLSYSEMEKLIIVQPGEDVTLNCSFTSELNHQLLNITWKKEQEKGPYLLVHSYSSQLGELETQDELYKGRTQLYPERFHEGNFSLRLQDVRLEDEGFYTCHVKPKLGRFSMRMRVTLETGTEMVQSQSALWWIDLAMLLVILVFAVLRMYSRRFWKWWLKKALLQSETQSPVSEVSDHKEDRSPLLQASLSTAMKSEVASPPQSPPAHSPEGQTAKDVGESKAISRAQIIAKLISIMQQKAFKHTKLDIAVIGELGCGKSSFINAMRGLCDEDEGAAPVGEEERMMEPKAYWHPKHPTVTFWRVPISQTQDFQPKLDLHDFFIIMDLEGFTSKYAELAKEIKKAGKMCYFVRSKVDADLDAARRSRPSTYNEEKILDEIRSYCIQCLEEEEMSNPEVFLLSGSELAKYDFALLQEAVEKDLPGNKKGAFILALPNVSLKILQKKKEVLQKQIWKIAILFAVTCVIPFVATIVDIILLLTCMKYHCQVFSLDDDSFMVLMRQFGKPARELKAVLKPWLTREISINVLLLFLSSVGCGVLIVADLQLRPLWVLEFMMPVGAVVVRFVAAGGISLVTTYVLLKTFLNGAAEGAQRILQSLQMKPT